METRPYQRARIDVARASWAYEKGIINSTFWFAMTGGGENGQIWGRKKRLSHTISIAWRRTFERAKAAKGKNQVLVPIKHRIWPGRNRVECVDFQVNWSQPDSSPLMVGVGTVRGEFRRRMLRTNKGAGKKKVDTKIETLGIAIGGAV